ERVRSRGDVEGRGLRPSPAAEEEELLPDAALERLLEDALVVDPQPQGSALEGVLERQGKARRRGGGPRSLRERRRGRRSDRAGRGDEEGERRGGGPPGPGHDPAAGPSRRPPGGGPRGRGGAAALAGVRG